MSELHNNYIGGEWVAGGGVTRNISPSNTNDVVGEYAQAARLGALLNEYLWHCAPDSPACTRGWYGAYNVSSRAQIVSRTFQMAFPLWLPGLANASQAAAAMDAILAPDMLGPFGVRSVSSADARYSEANIIDPYSNCEAGTAEACGAAPAPRRRTHARPFSSLLFFDTQGEGPFG